jgi:hypothetical protein
VLASHHPGQDGRGWVGVRDGAYPADPALQQAWGRPQPWRQPGRPGCQQFGNGGDRGLHLLGGVLDFLPGGCGRLGGLLGFLDRRIGLERCFSVRREQAYGVLGGTGSLLVGLSQPCGVTLG